MQLCMNLTNMMRMGWVIIHILWSHSYKLKNLTIHFLGMHYRWKMKWMLDTSECLSQVRIAVTLGGEPKIRASKAVFFNLFLILVRQRSFFGQLFSWSHSHSSPPMKFQYYRYIIYMFMYYGSWGGPTHHSSTYDFFSHPVLSSENQFSSAWRPITRAENACSKLLAMLYVLTWRVGTQVFA